MTASTIILIVLIIFVLIAFLLTFKVVPQRSVYIIERVGKYSRSLHAGFHILIPFIDRIAYKQNLKEQAIDVASQMCITKDNIAVEVDGILYIQVIDPQKASYGIDNYKFAIIQLAQTTMRSIIGRMELDKTFEERETVNATIVEAVDKASEPWGLKVSRYEVKNISPPQSIRDAMEKQMRAEREKRAKIAESEGDKQAKINRAEGEAKAILALAEANAEALRKIGAAIREPGGSDAVNLKVAEQSVAAFDGIARTNNTLIIPATMSDLGGLIASAMTIAKTQKPQGAVL